MDKSGVGGGQGGAREYFTEGAGMPYPAHPYVSPDKTNEKRNTQVLIDLNDLNKPGVGPVDFDEVSRGRILSPLTTKAAGKKSGDID